MNFLCVLWRNWIHVRFLWRSPMRFVTSAFSNWRKRCLVLSFSPSFIIGENNTRGMSSSCSYEMCLLRKNFGAHYQKVFFFQFWIFFGVKISIFENIAASELRKKNLLWACRKLCRSWCIDKYSSINISIAIRIFRVFKTFKKTVKANMY